MSTDERDAGWGVTRKKPSGLSDARKLGIAFHELEYEMNHIKRGVCVLFNNKHFDKRTGQNTRDGTDTDAEQVEVAFRSLGFDVNRLDDCSRAVMSSSMSNYAAMDHSNHDCFACVILSHGLLGQVYATDGAIAIDSLVAPFKGDRCKTLRGKPKLFFIQACRGMQFDRGVEQHDAKGDDQMDAAVPTRKIPVEADFLMAYSTVPGFYSWRNNQDGSWFIQCLVRVIKEHGKAGELELHHMMVVVNRLVAMEYESCTDAEWTDRMKQMPSVVSMLTRLLYFRNSSKETR